MKRIATWILAGCLLLGLTACGQDSAHVFVQKVSELSQMGGIAPTDRFGGIVVSENVTEIKRDSDKVIEEVYVKQGDDVREGQKLFTYDTEQLQLTLDKQRLEAEQLQSSIENYGTQIAQLEKDRDRASTSDKLKYTLQIQTNQIDLKESELKLKTKQSEVQKSEYLLANAVVTSPVDGRITSLGDESTDNNGNPKPYITIQQAGTYRVKGVLNEMQRGAIVEGDRMRIVSRTDPNVFWMGTVTLVDYENPNQSSGNRYSDSNDEMGNSSKYPFYVELDSSDGVLLGQHVYLSVVQESQEPLEGLTLGSAFVCFDENENAYVWADDGQGKLEKRPVELGEYDAMEDVYQILSGLRETDYVAFPDETVCVEGAPTTKTQQTARTTQQEGEPVQ